MMMKIFRWIGFFIVELYIALKNIFGKEKALKIMKNFMTLLGKTRAPAMAKILKANPSDMSSLSKIQDAEDFILGVKGIWSEKGKNLAIKDELFCPFAQKLKGQGKVIIYTAKSKAFIKNINGETRISAPNFVGAIGPLKLNFLHDSFEISGSGKIILRI
jgi:hypothetical protein